MVQKHGQCLNNVSIKLEVFKCGQMKNNIVAGNEKKANKVLAVLQNVGLKTILLNEI